MPLDAFTSHLGYEQGRIIPKFHASSFDANGNVIDGTVAQIISGVSEPFALSEGDEFVISVDHDPRAHVFFDGDDFADIGNATAAEIAVVLERDIGRARIISVAEPFDLADEDALVLRLNDGSDETIEFDAADFADISAATSDEVAAVFTAASIVGLLARSIGGRVVLETDTYGADASIDIVSGAANAALRFTTNRITGGAQVLADELAGDLVVRSQIIGALGCLHVIDLSLDNANQTLQFGTDEVCGTTGAYSFVLGFDTPGHIETITGGDYVQIGQSAPDFGTGQVLRIFGEYRIPESPSGYTWRITATTGGYDEVIEFASGVFETFDLIDYAINVVGVAGPQDVTIRLSLEGPATATEVEFPALYLDVLGFLEGGEQPLVLANRIPRPGQTRVPHDFTDIALMLLETSGDAIDLTATQVYIEGVLAYDGTAGGFQVGFAGVATPGDGPNGADARLVIDTSAQTYASSQVIDVRVVSTNQLATDTIDETYSFTLADTIAPEVTSASARSKRVVRVVFSEAMSDDVLFAANYTFERLSVPAVEIAAVSVERVSSTTVDVTVDTEMTFNASYRVSVLDVTDLEDNVIAAPANVATFVGYVCPVPAGRDFNLYQMMSEFDRRADNSGDLERLLVVLQEPIDQVLCLIDDWTNILDPDLAPDDFIDAMLIGLGNPWRFDLDATEKRRLLAVLIAIYQAKGTTFGIVDTIFFFMGIDVEINPLNDFDGAWFLGDSELGEDTLLGASDIAILFTFEILVPFALTDEQRAMMLKIATYMKPAPEHIRIVEPDETVDLIYWQLGESELGHDTILSQTL